MGVGVHFLLATALLLAAVLVGTANAHSDAPSRAVGVRNVRTRVEAAVRVSASPSALRHTGEWVEVSFEGVGSPHKGDWVGVYSPADADVHSTAPVKWQHADVSAEYLRTGAGKLRFRLINMRASYVFHFMRNGTAHPVLVSSSNHVTFANYNEPTQGRIMLTGRPSEMRVMWTTLNASRPAVRFGTATGQLTLTAAASSSTYHREQLCGAPANADGWRDPGLLHSAVLTGLRPDTRYYYVYGDEAYGWSAERSFVSGPTAEQRDRSLTLFAFGDMGKTTQDDSKEHWNLEGASRNTTRLMMEDMAAQPRDLLLHIGDIAYAVGYSAQWDEFHDMVEPLATQLPYMTCIGNHERDFPNSGSYYTGSDSGGECGVPYEARFPMPTPARDQPWYSFDYGFVHFTFMSTEHDYSIGSKQWLWLEEDLRRVNRSATPWVIFSGHRPMYISTKTESHSARHMRKELEDVLHKHKVDLALWGHNHSYQRSCPVYKETCVPEGHGVTHVVIGMGGFRLGQVGDHDPSWARVVNNKENGYTRLHITPSELDMQFVSDIDGGVKDHFSLHK